MPAQMLTSHGELDAAIDTLLKTADAALDVFDHDLSWLSLERPQRIAELERILRERSHRVRIIVQDGSRLSARSPRLMRLFETHAHHFELVQAPDRLGELRDSMLIADNRNALVRFHRDQPRGKLIEDDPDEVRGYAMRFAEVVDEGGHPLSPRVAGL